MTPQAHPQPTTMASSALAFGPAPLASVLADNALGVARALARSVLSNLNATTNQVVASDPSLVNSARTSLTRNASSISIASNAIYSANGNTSDNTSDNTSVTTLIEVERRGAERIAQVPTVTGSTRDLTTIRTEARTPRTACPAFTRRPLSTMTRTTNTPLRRASGDLRSLH